MIKYEKTTIATNSTAKMYAGKATYLRVLDSSGVKIRAFLDNGSTFILEAGLGFETLPFNEARFETLDGASCQIEIVLSDEGDITDSRLVLTGVMSVTTMASESVDIKPIQTLDIADGLTEVLAAASNRKQANVQLSGDCWIGGSVNGILVTGDILWESRAALSLEAVADGTTIRIMDEVN